MRSSIRKKLDASFDAKDDTSTYHTDALAVIDTMQNLAPLELERLHRWHVALLSNITSRFAKIQLEVFRHHDDMQIVSGVIGKEKVHFVALPAKRIDEDIDSLLIPNTKAFTIEVLM